MTAKIDRERHVDCGFVIPKKFSRDAKGDNFKIPEKFSNLLSVLPTARESDNPGGDEIKLTDSEFWLFTWLKSFSNVFSNLSDDAAMSIVKADNCDIPLANGFLEKRGNTFSFDSTKMDLNEMAKLAVSAAAFAQSKISVFGPPDFIRLVMKYSEDMQVEIDVVNFTTLAKSSRFDDGGDLISSQETPSSLPGSDLLSIEEANVVSYGEHAPSSPDVSFHSYEEPANYEPVDYDQLLNEGLADLVEHKAKTRDKFVEANAGWEHEADALSPQFLSDDAPTIFDQLSAEDQQQAALTSFKP